MSTVSTLLLTFFVLCQLQARRLSGLTESSSGGKRDRNDILTHDLALKAILEKKAKAEKEISAWALSGISTILQSSSTSVRAPPIVLNFSINRSPGEQSPTKTLSPPPKFYRPSGCRLTPSWPPKYMDRLHQLQSWSFISPQPRKLRTSFCFFFFSQGLI